MSVQMQTAGNMAYRASDTYGAVNGHQHMYPNTSGNVTVDQMKPIVLGQLNSFRCKCLLLVWLFYLFINKDHTTVWI